MAFKYTIYKENDKANLVRFIPQPIEDFKKKKIRSVILLELDILTIVQDKCKIFFLLKVINYNKKIYILKKEK